MNETATATEAGSETQEAPAMHPTITALSSRQKRDMEYLQTGLKSQSAAIDRLLAEGYSEEVGATLSAGMSSGFYRPFNSSYLSDTLDELKKASVETCPTCGQPKGKHHE